MKRSKILLIILLLLVTSLLTGCSAKCVIDFDERHAEGYSSYTTTFVNNGGTEMPAIVMPIGASTDFFVSPTKDGYIFCGWFTDEELTQPYKFDNDSKDITLYAGWTNDINDSYAYRPVKGGYEISKYLGTEIGEITIPAMYKGLPVISIGYKAFSNTTPTSVVLPESVTNFVSFCFAESSLYSFRVKANFDVGAYCFANCKLLDSIIFNISVIPKGTCYNCQKLKACSFSNLKEIGNQAFMNCRIMSKVRVPYTLKSIGASAFAGCSSLKNQFATTNNVNYIGKFAFRNCYNLNAYVITNQIRNIDEGAFVNCKNCYVYMPTEYLFMYLNPAWIDNINKLMLF